MDTNYAYLHVHSNYSLNDSASSVEDIVKKAKESGIKSVSLTDHGTLLGIPSFMKYGEKYGVNTVPGVEFYLEERKHLIVIAKDYAGYVSISHALRDAWKNQGIYKKKCYPILSKQLLEKHFKNNEHVIATSACVNGPIASILLENFYKREKENKIKDLLVQLQPEYELYLKVQKQIQILTSEISDMDKEIKSLKKYTNPKYIKKIHDLALQYEFDFDNGCSITPFELQQEILLAETAEERISELNQQLQSEKEERTKYKKHLSALAKVKKKYDAYHKQIRSFKYRKDTELIQCAIEELHFYKNIFPCFYIEVQNHNLPQELYVMPLLEKIAKETGTMMIAANDAHMINNTEDEIRARELIRFNQFKRAQQSTDIDKELYLKSRQELKNMLNNILSTEEMVEEALSNTTILNSCHVIFPKEKHYPKVDNGEAEFDALIEKARKEKIDDGVWDERYEKRLRYEISIIKEMGYVDYHLIVRDFCNMGRILGTIPKNEIYNIPKNYQFVEKWIKEKKFDVGIGIGPGRGSAAGSLVCYILGITNIDPIRYNLLFERFLNPERISMPDIDTDIRTSIRPILIQYLKWKKGDDAICSIDTENTYAARNAILLAVRNKASELFGDSKDKIKEFKHKWNTLTDLIPEASSDSLSMYADLFEQKYKGNKLATQIWHDAELVEGKISGTGIHAGGVIISDNDDVNDYIPLQWSEDKQVWAAQCNMNSVEEHGLLKMDLLGLNTLDVITDTVIFVKQQEGISINLDQIPFEKEVFEQIYSKGFTNSVFQFESAGMKNMLKDFKPESIDDLILLVAMYRPGPMDFIPDVIAIKKGLKPKTYITPELESILDNTYGAIVYQEQVMEIFQSLAGYTLGQSDLVRRAISKKKEHIILNERNAFIFGDSDRNIKGCIKNGISEEAANKVFDQIVDFGKYCFNKSHAASYAVLSYQTAYLKYHFPVEFESAVFCNKTQDEFEPIIEDCRILGIEILHPDINKSYYDFTIEKERNIKKIRFGFSGIKGIANPDIINRFVKKRSNMYASEYYQSLSDFLLRNLDERGNLLKKDIAESLIKSGCFDSFVKNREEAFSHYLYAAEKSKRIELQNISIELQERENTISCISVEKMSNRKYDIEYLGAIIEQDPLSEYSDDKTYSCIPMNELKDTKDGNVLAFVYDAEKKLNRKNNMMGVLYVQGKQGKMKLYLTRNVFERYQSKMDAMIGTVIKASGTIKAENQIMFVKRIQEHFAPQKENFFIDVYDMDTYHTVNKALLNKGNPECNLYIQCWIDSNGKKYDRPVSICQREISYEVLKKIQK